jgi:hypothetical protein
MPTKHVHVKGSLKTVTTKHGGSKTIHTMPHQRDIGGAKAIYNSNKNLPPKMRIK